MHRGYVKSWRKLLESDLFKNPKLAHFWEWCRLKASHKAHQQIVGYQTVDLLPGQFVTGRVKATKETGLSQQTVRTCLAALVREGRIKSTKHPTRQFTIISICNWELYQSNDSANTQPSTSLQPTSNQPLTTNKNVKNSKGGAAKPPPSETPAPTAPPESVKKATGRLVKLWHDKYAERRGYRYPKSEKGKLVGILGNLLTIASEADLTASITRWFGANRKDFGIELFKLKLVGGDAELTDRDVQQPQPGDEQARRNWPKIENKEP